MSSKKRNIIIITALISIISINAFSGGIAPSFLENTLLGKFLTSVFKVPYNQATKLTGTTGYIDTGSQNKLINSNFESPTPTFGWNEASSDFSKVSKEENNCKSGSCISIKKDTVDAVSLAPELRQSITHTSREIGNSILASIWIDRGDNDSGDYEVCLDDICRDIVHFGYAKYEFPSNAKLTNVFYIRPKNGVFPTNKQIELYIDIAYVGILPEGYKSNVSDANYVGSATWTSPSVITWQCSSDVWGTCTSTTAPTPSVKGKVTVPDKDLPNIRIPNSRLDGTYHVFIRGWFYGNNYNNIYKIGISNGTDISGIKELRSNASQIGETNYIEGQFKGNGSDLNIYLATRDYGTYGGDFVGVRLESASDRQLDFDVYFYPDSSSTIVSQETELTADTANELSFNVRNNGVCTIENDIYNVVTNVVRIGTGNCQVTFKSGLMSNTEYGCLATGTSDSTVSYACVKDSINTISVVGWDGSYYDRNATVKLIKNKEKYNKSQTIIGKVVNRKCQTKYLTTNITSTGIMSDLTFNNLIIGKKYSIKGQAYILASTAVNILNGAIIVGGIRIMSSGSYEKIVNPNTGTFTATNSVVTFNKILGNTLYGDNSKSTTFMELCEENGTLDTTEFN